MSHRPLSEIGFVRLSTILQLVPVSKSTWWAKVKTGEYPQPLKIGGNITAWKSKDILELIQQLEDTAEAMRCESTE